MGLKGFSAALAGEVAPFGVTIADPGTLRAANTLMAEPLEVHRETPVAVMRELSANPAVVNG